MSSIDDIIDQLEHYLEEELEPSEALALLVLGAVLLILLACSAFVLVRRLLRDPPPVASACEDEPDPPSPKPSKQQQQQQQTADDGGGARKSKSKKTHIFLILGHDYYQKLAKLNPRTITTLSSLQSTIQELFSQELFAHELVANKNNNNGGAAGGATPNKKLRIADMEMQYLDERCGGAPTLVTSSTPIDHVLASSALLLSDRPVAEMVANGTQQSEDLHARSCKVAWGTACLLCFGGKELQGTPLTAKALREHSDAVTTFCFLKNQVPSGHFGVYHFPLADTVVEKLPAGMIHWSDEEAQAYGVPKEDYFVGCEEELCAEYVYELAIVSRGLSVRSRL